MLYFFFMTTYIYFDVLNPQLQLQELQRNDTYPMPIHFFASHQSFPEA